MFLYVSGWGNLSGDWNKFLNFSSKSGNSCFVVDVFIDECLGGGGGGVLLFRGT